MRLNPHRAALNPLGLLQAPAEQHGVRGALTAGPSSLHIVPLTAALAPTSPSAHTGTEVSLWSSSSGQLFFSFQLYLSLK